MSNLAQCEVLVMALPEAERWQLADRLLESLSDHRGWTSEEIISEALKRGSEMESDPESVLSEDEFWARLKQKQGS